MRAWDRLDHRARTCRAAGDPLSLDKLRADLFANALADAGLDASTATLHEKIGLDECRAGQPGESIDSDEDCDNDAEHLREAARASQRARKPVSVQVTIALTSLLGVDSCNGWLDGYGAMTPGTARGIMASGDTTLTRLLVDPVTGSVISADPRKYRRDAATRHAVTCRDVHCRLSVCTARARDLDHKQAFADGGLTTPGSLQGLCERSHLAKSHPGWSVTGDTETVTIWCTPTGREYPSLPPPATGYGTGPPGEVEYPFSVPEWLSERQRMTAFLKRGSGDGSGVGDDRAA